uniref:DUF155 domain-containing protein n=1 Tax=Chromera velia CCMP2878 TaxID=1169474 RepID=A0A0G4F7T6_9ALVE|mmetsp:Transcript_15103/g.30611  ORF Transcript_15103/g.30611 Transcript_15103/m.30611 type:complete len:376 (+) Transcript_15103:212-1339(+)|eukprot:Cvel_15521.t1-p1 / transcript=Cvel_15521.t1 / gene=Cvel_15521 / organism=Chromera_velia_CCMP2878 / gene_product=Sporulation protein RMD1, putative / transcript_product=Sporulation protein RMD1, putative / location=Cvel_scaffold1153:21-5667(-) / protein_length=375 / sequence_SO=supercontig / SO=protein_coding / is_pseudo=false
MVRAVGLWKSLLCLRAVRPLHGAAFLSTTPPRLTGGHIDSSETTATPLHGRRPLLKEPSRKDELLLPNIELHRNPEMRPPLPRVCVRCESLGWNLRSLAVHLRSLGCFTWLSDSCLVSGTSDEFSEQEGVRAFFFRQGFCVFWNCDAQTETRFISTAAEFQTDISTGQTFTLQGEEDREFWSGASEEMEVLETDGETRLDERTLHLSSGPKRLSDQFAVSLAFVTACRLNILESKIDRQLKLERETIDMMEATSGKLNLVSEVLFKSKKALHSLRYDLNIGQEISDVPDILWEFPDQERLFLQMRRHFDVGPRVNTLNARLSWMNDLIQNFSEHVHHKYASRLEIIIIFLIGIEIVLQVIPQVIPFISSAQTPDT